MKYNLPGNSRLNIVLVNPQIPWNTGNIGRTCVATGSKLHLVGNLGFSLDDAQLKRAGLDYWHKLSWRRYGDFDEFEKSLPEGAELFFYSKKASESFWTANFAKINYLIFGSETDGLPGHIHDKYPTKFYKVPQTDEVRSLNLSTCAGIVIYEALRQSLVDKVIK